MTNSTVLAPSFELTRYLEERTKNDAFLLIEFGHGNYPVVDLQPQPFTGQQCYIGIEADMRNQGNQYHQKRVSGPFTKKNAFFMDQYIGTGRLVRQNVASFDQSYEGEYRTETVLPAGVADEIVASNVFCDPLIAESQERTVGLLHEISRLLRLTGVAILRETITPTFVQHITTESLGTVGLQKIARVTPAMAMQWQSLEKLYGISHRPNLARGYYIILGKTAVPNVQT